MKKILLTLGIISAMLFGFPIIAQNSAAVSQESNTIEVVPTMNTKSNNPNRIWVGTFQIVWNEFTENIIKHPVEFVDFNSQVAQDLNNKEFTKKNISDKSYYTKSGVVSPKLKKEIEKGIKRKFKEKSDILSSFDWSYRPGKILVYAMLKKDFKFLQDFDKLSDGQFGNNPTQVKYFGINDNSKPSLYTNVEVLFYNSSDDFGVKLFTQSNDEVILYRTNDDKEFNRYYSDLTAKTQNYSGNRHFNRDDRLRIPDINLYQKTSFTELEGHPIKNSNFMIDKTIETVEFKMNNKGVKLKSEAGLMTRFTSLAPTGRYFMFTDNFVLFLTEKNQKTPYYAMKVSDIETINKTGK